MIADYGATACRCLRIRKTKRPKIKPRLATPRIAGRWLGDAAKCSRFHSVSRPCPGWAVAELDIDKIEVATRTSCGKLFRFMVVLFSSVPNDYRRINTA